MVHYNLNHYLQRIPAGIVKKIRQFEEKKKKEINSKWSHIFNNLCFTKVKLHFYALSLPVPEIGNC